LNSDTIMKKYLCVFVLLCIALTSVACNRSEYKEIRVYPFPQELSAARGDESFIALRVEIPAGHHIYGNQKGPGIGKPTQIFIKAGDGILFYETRYLPSKKFYFPGEQEYTLGYERETTIFVPFKIREDARTGVHPVRITFDALMCNDTVSIGAASKASACMPIFSQINYSIKVLPKGPAGTIYNQETISEYEISKAPIRQYETDQGQKETVHVSGADELFPDVHFNPRFIQSGVSGLLQAILFGIIAGFILNFMPCVLPVVSIKVLSFVQHADKNRRQLFSLGALFSLGILTSFALLATLAAFFGYNWGGLFQNRVFLVIMTGFVFAMALSLFGVYSIHIPAFAGKAAGQSENMYADAYIKGLFATLLATPCSGPFLGGTLAWTLSKPPQTIFLIFMCIGFGMSLPYLILAINPKILRFLPKSGEWLKTFEEGMAFLLVFTTIYLLNIFDTGSKMAALTFLAFIGVGFWQYGRYGSLIHGKITRFISSALLVVIIIAGYLFSFHYLYLEHEPEKIVQNDFTIHRVFENRKAGRISMIEFTADWCPNCKLVEKISLHTRAVASAVRDGNIDFMKADITRKNPAAEKLLLMFHNQSIPLLSVIPPGEQFENPVILRDIYSEEDVLNAIDIAMRGGKSKAKMQYQLEMNIK
jgi:thiol:disulfide interchange protein